MPQLEGGDVKSVTEKAKSTSAKLKKFIDDGYKILSIVPSCSLMIKYEWPLLIPDSKEVKYLSENTFDICEYLVKFLNDNSLLNQLWIMDPKKKVKDVIKDFAGKDKIIVKEFIRFKVGEGI